MAESYEEYKKGMLERYYAHRDHFIEYQPKYRETNKDKLSSKVSCACGSVYRYSSAAELKKTKKHRAFTAPS